MGRIVGIDLGTTNSAVAVWGKKGPELVPAAGGSRLTPSVVGFGEQGEVLVGAAARSQVSANAQHTIYSAKRFMGRSFAAATADREDVAYEVVEGEHGEACFLIDGMPLPPEQISAVVLRELKRCAEEHLQETVDGAVITAPAHFNDAQRAATRKAAGLAGLQVRRILNEPTAAALAYGLDKMVEGEKVVAVYDFGGGTFDVSILSIGEDIVEVLATRGDPHLGGDMIDSRLASWLLARFEEETGTTVDEDAAALRILSEAAERAKIGLSESDTTEIRLAFPGTDEGDTPQLATTLTRVIFNDLVGELVERTLACCDQVLADAGKPVDQIDEVVLAGGSTRIPLVRNRVEKYFGRKPHCSLDPDEIVAMGAAVQAGIIAGAVKGMILVDVTSLSLGIETHEGRASVIIPRNTALPVTATRTFTTSVDDQVAVQFHVVQGESERAEKNDSLGRFVLDGLKPARAGTPQIDVTFTIDINGMVLVSARDHATGQEQTVTVSVATVSGRHSPDRPDANASQPKKTAGAKVTPTDDGAPPEVRELLRQADGLLALAGEKLTRVDRASLMKNVKLLRAAVADAIDEESVEKCRKALAKVVARVQNAKPARRRI